MDTPPHSGRRFHQTSGNSNKTDLTLFLPAFLADLTLQRTRTVFSDQGALKSAKQRPTIFTHFTTTSLACASTAKAARNLVINPPKPRHCGRSKTCDNYINDSCAHLHGHDLGLVHSVLLAQTRQIISAQQVEHDKGEFY